MSEVISLLSRRGYPELDLTDRQNGIFCSSHVESVLINYVSIFMQGYGWPRTFSHNYHIVLPRSNGHIIGL